MKKIILTVVLTFSLFFSSCGQLKVFKGAENIPGVETVYLGGTILRMGLNSAGKEYAEMGKELGADISTIEAMEVISAENQTAIAKIKPLIERAVKEGKYEIGTQVTEDDESTTIYLSPANNKQRSNMLIVSQEKDELDVVLLQGITFTTKKK